MTDLAGNIEDMRFKNDEPSTCKPSALGSKIKRLESLSSAALIFF